MKDGRRASGGAVGRTTAGGTAAATWADPRSLRNGQYRTDSNLRARQTVYSYQEPWVDLPAAVLDLLRLRGDEVIADVGCGNGEYLAELARRGHRGPAVGVDLSEGMLRVARERGPTRAAVAGDAVALPLADTSAHVALATHMLYHVRDPLAALRELRRVTHPGGRVVIALNGADHLRELRGLIPIAVRDLGGPMAPSAAALAAPEPLTLDDGAALAGEVFGAVRRHDFRAELLLPDPRPVADYVRSMVGVQQAPDGERLVTAVARHVRLGDDGVFRVRTHSGCLICF